MRLREIMNRRFARVTPDTTLREAARRMQAWSTPILPVCARGKLVGLLTPRDLIVRATAQGCDPRTARVREVMQTPPVYAYADQSVAVAVQRLRQWRLPLLPVVDRQSRLVGLVAWCNLDRKPPLLWCAC